MKFVILGSQNSGKTSLWQRWMGLDYRRNYNETFLNSPGIEFNIEKYRGTAVVFEWIEDMDIKYKTLYSGLFKAVSAIFIVIDVTSSSRTKFVKFLEMIRNEVNNTSIPIALLANKVDLVKKGTIPKMKDKIAREAKSLLKNYNYRIFAISVATRYNLDIVLHWAITETPVYREIT